MAIHLGSDKIKDIYLGNTKIDKIYHGQDLVYSSAPPFYYASVSGLGSQNSSDVIFNVDQNFPFVFDEVEIMNSSTGVNDTFIKIPKMSRRIDSIASNQITGFTMATGKPDGFDVYPCFLKEDGITEMDYILVGKYVNTSSSYINSVSGGSNVNLTPSDARTKAGALGIGYQLFDWQINKLLQDLIIMYLKTINTNDGNGFSSILGLEDMGGGYTYIDGMLNKTYNEKWSFCYQPSHYQNSASSYYNQTSYNRSSSAGCIQKLGYDSNHPFVNMPSAKVSDSTYSSYYCDQIMFEGGATPNIKAPNINYGGVIPANGVYQIYGNNFTSTSRQRLCYRPI